MIILDTNVISEPRSLPAMLLPGWTCSKRKTLYLTATSLAELLVGIELLPDGRCKQGLDRALGDLMSVLFGSRILPFDERAAKRYAPLLGRARASGRVISFADGQIAAIATLHGFSVATRDVAPFEAAGVPVVNPFAPD